MLFVQFIIFGVGSCGCGGRNAVALAAGVCLAAVDEFSQLGVSGRSGSLIDVGIDTAGVVIGSVIGWLIMRRKC